jgi:ATP-dependent DNA ligase
MLKQIKPARAEQVILTDEDLDKVAKDGFIAEEKMDGARYKLHTFSDGNRIDSRRLSVDGSGFVEKTNNVPHIRDVPLPAGWVADTEIIARHGVTSHDRCANTTSIMGSLPARALALQEEHGNVLVNVFDILFAEGRDIRRLPLYERLKYVDQFVATAGDAGSKDIVHIRRWMNPAHFQSAFRIITEDDKGEGLIIKDLSKPYGHVDAWFKYKWHFDIDVIATGTVTKGKGKYGDTAGAIHFGLWNGSKIVEVGKCSGMNDTIRDEIWLSATRNTLQGRIFECRGWEVTKAGSIRNANFKRWRTDKDITDCTFASQLDPVIRRNK